MDDTGAEAGLEWNTSEISASTSVFDITQNLNSTSELNYTAMSELVFGNSLNSASCSTVPTQESIVADTLAALEHVEFTPDNITSGKLAKEKRKSTSRGNKRKHKQSISPNESYLTESSENSINYSAIQSAILLPNVNQLFSSQAESNANHPVQNSSPNSTISNDDVSITIRTLTKHPQVYQQDGNEKNHMSQSSFNISGSTDTSSTSGSQLNRTYDTSRNSSSVFDSSSNQTVGKINPPLITSTQSANMEQAQNSTLPSIPKRGRKKELNAAPKTVGKKKPTKGATKMKSKGIQVNIKTKAPSANVDQKKTTGEKVTRKKLMPNKIEKQEHNQLIEGSIKENNVNVNLGDPPEFQMKSKETLLKEKVEDLLNMPSTSHAVPDINNTIGTVDINNTMGSSDLDQSQSETLVSKSCSVKIIKDANRASQINIVLPREANLSLSKKNVTSTKTKIKSSPSNNIRKDSLMARSGTPKQGKIKIKQEKLTPEPKNIQKEDRQDKKGHSRKIKSEPKNIQKEDRQDKKGHSRKIKTPNSGKKKHGKASPAPKTKRIQCGYMSSGSSEDSDESSDYSRGSSSSCSCSDCAGYCDCSFCQHSTSCSCSSCSQSSYETPPRRRRHR